MVSNFIIVLIVLLMIRFQTLICSYLEAARFAMVNRIEFGDESLRDGETASLVMVKQHNANYDLLEVQTILLLGSR